MNRLRNLGRRRQMHAGSRCGDLKPTRVESNEFSGLKTSLNLPLHPLLGLKAAKRRPVLSEFLASPEFALQASAGIRGREIGRVSVLRKG
jgi:hypothetical protein